MKIRKSDIEIVKLTTKELLLTLFDLSTPFYLASRMYRQSTKEYLDQRSIDRAEFISRLKYLKRQGYIESFVQNKEKYIELTSRGKNRANDLLIDELKSHRPDKWDGKWRVLIFDIPESKKQNRDIFRNKIKSLGFIQIQKSVYVYPFECTQEISFLLESLLIQKYVTIMVSEIIQGEEKIVNEFLEKEIIKNSDLRKSQSK